MSVADFRQRAGGARDVDDWVVIGRAQDVPLLEGRSVEVAGRRLAIFRLPDGWAAIDHACPHKQGPLSDGIVTEACAVTCPLHAQRFSLRTGERVGSEGPGVRTYAVRESDGNLQLRVADLELAEESADDLADVPLEPAA